MCAKSILPADTLREAATMATVQTGVVLRVLLERNLDAQRADADLDLLLTGTATLLWPKVVSQTYFHQLRLRVARDPSLASRIEVLYRDEQGVHPIDLSDEKPYNWPPGFCMEDWEIEHAIDAARAALRTPT